jgi:hypothetical protein
MPKSPVFDVVKSSSSLSGSQPLSALQCLVAILTKTIKSIDICNYYLSRLAGLSEPAIAAFGENFSATMRPALRRLSERRAFR